MRVSARCGAILLAGILGASAVGWATDEKVDAQATDTEAADTEAPTDEAIGKCVSQCESEHDKCATTAKSRQDDCERQKAACDSRCSMCTRMYGPQVVYCVNDCNACRARIAASPCAKDAADDTDCARALDACLERCGP